MADKKDEYENQIYSLSFQLNCFIFTANSVKFIDLPMVIDCSAHYLINYEEADLKYPSKDCVNLVTFSTSEHIDNIDEQNINDYHFEDEPYSAPVEVFAEFLSTLMARNYNSALYYCKLILLYEPDNEVAQDFYPLILEKIHPSNDECGEKDDNGSSTPSESSTEYFSSTSIASENMSSCSSSNCSEEDISG